MVSIFLCNTNIYKKLYGFKLLLRMTKLTDKQTNNNDNNNMYIIEDHNC